MPVLDDADLRRLRAQLDAREDVLRAEVRLVDAEADGTPGSVPHSQVEDIGEQAEERIRGALRHAERERDIDELRAIEAARERMARGSYGVCVDCGVEIPRDRLEVQPAAMRCLPCQERYERSHATGMHVPPVL
jgi:RNA polymerase-binding transcription factor DksA